MPGALKSVLAVFSGFLTMVILVMLFTGALRMLAPSWFPVDGAPTGPYLIANVLYSFLAAVAGGYVAARIASRLPVHHAIALASLVLCMSILSAVYYAARQPRWYQVLLAVMMPPTVVLGGYVRAAAMVRRKYEHPN